MKIALFFAGELRDFAVTKDYWKSLVEDYHIDVYGSFWDTDEETKKIFLDTLKPKNVEFENRESFRHFREMIKKNLLPPSDLTYDTQEMVNTCRFFNQHYRVWRGCILANQDEYDVVIKARTDTVLAGNLKIEINDYLNVPTGHVGIWSWGNNSGPLDLFAYGNPKVMNYLSSLFLHLNRYLFNGEYLFPGENLTRVHISQKDIIINYMPVKIWLSRDLKNHFSGYEGDGPTVGLVHSQSCFHRPTPEFTFYRENREI